HAARQPEAVLALAARQPDQRVVLRARRGIVQERQLDGLLVRARRLRRDPRVRGAGAAAAGDARAAERGQRAGRRRRRRSERMRFRVGVLGARGHVAAELMPLLRVHPGLELAALGSRSLAGQALAGSALTYRPLDPEAAAALALDAWVLGLPNGE